jgi:uncharacterized protein YhbP (UPF0306 family)
VIVHDLALVRTAAKRAAALPTVLVAGRTSGVTNGVDTGMTIAGRAVVPIERSRQRVAATRLEAVARDLLEASPLCAVATVTPDGDAYVNTAYFAASPELLLVWLSDPDATHSRNLVAAGTSAVAVYNSTQTWGKPDRGMQLFGAAHQATDAESSAAEAVYARRFADFRSKNLAAYRFYVFRPTRVKLFHEDELGAGRFILAAVDSSGRLTWEATELYRSGSDAETSPPRP